MQNEKENLQHRYYILLDNRTKKTFYITLYGKTYMFIANNKYFLNKYKELFSLKEKLFILTLPYDVVWRPISTAHMIYKSIFYNAISPTKLRLDINNGRVTPYIAKKGGF